MRNILLKYGFEECGLLTFRIKLSDDMEFICDLKRGGTWWLARYVYTEDTEEPFLTTWHVKDAELMEKILQKNGMKQIKEE
jgi:hypothetical protein